MLTGKIKLRGIRFVLLIMTTLFVVNSHAQEEKVLDKIIGVLGDEIVLMSDLQITKLGLEAQGVSEEEVTSCQILEQIMFDKLMSHQAKVDSIEISDDQVNAELDKRISYFLQQFEGDIKKMEEFYGKSLGQIKDQYRDQVREKLRVESMKYSIEGGISVTPKEVKEFFKEIPKDSIPLVNSQVEISQIAAIPEVSPEARLKAKRDLEGYRQKIIDGTTSFETMATLNSQDPGSSGKGGDLGWVFKGRLVPKFDAMAQRLKPGEISLVFETDFGFHIMQLIERRGDQYHAKHILRSPKISTEDLVKSVELLEEALKKLNAEEITFKEAVAQYSQDENTNNNFGLLINPYTSSTKFDMAHLDKDLFLSTNNLKVGEYSGVVGMKTQNGRDAFRVVKLTSKSEPHKASLETDYQMIQGFTKEVKKESIYNDWIAKNGPNAFVKLNDEYKTCPFNYEWIIVE